MLKIDTAKEIAMIENNKMGRKISYQSVDKILKSSCTVAPASLPATPKTLLLAKPSEQPAGTPALRLEKFFYFVY